MVNEVSKASKVSQIASKIAEKIKDIVSSKTLTNGNEISTLIVQEISQEITPAVIPNPVVMVVVQVEIYSMVSKLIGLSSPVKA